jgi:L-aminopeptidase/D-esterase-like protein
MEREKAVGDEDRGRVSRRQFLHVGGTTILAATPTLVATARQSAPIPSAGSLTDIGGVRVGHFTDTRRPTGCTAILFDKPATAGADYDGSAPGETLGVMLQPVSPLDRIHGVLLGGGGPMGLGATAGVVRFLDEQRVGYDWGVPNVRVPIVVGAIIDDLAIGDGRIRVGPDEAYRACQAATSGAVAEGSVGAGAGATVGKIFVARGMPGMKGGIGSASVRLGDVVIAALVVVNSAGDILDWRSGTIVAGARTADGGGFARSVEVLRRDLETRPAANAPLADDPLRATLLVVVGTNVTLTKIQLTKLAMMANTGAARAINPYHTQGDGDQVIAVSTGLSNASVSLTALGAIAAEVVADAIVRAVRTATGVAGWTAVRDL